MNHTLPPAESISLFSVTLRTSAALLFSLFLTILSSGVFAATFYVRATATGLGTGASWSDASGNLQTMIDGAASGEQVWVAGGTYVPEIDAVFNKRFKMKEGVKIYGGFAGTEGTLSDRDLRINANKSTLQGFLNSSSTVYNAGNLTAASLLDGFTLTGSVNGIWNINSSPTLVNLIITGGTFGAPGVRNESSSPILINCSIINNMGSGMSNTASSPILINCTIAGNTYSVSNTGYGMFNSASFPQIRNSIISGNKSGITNEAGSVPVIQYSLVQGESNTDPANHNYPGDGDPLFVNAEAGDYRLQPCSPGIDKGSNAFYASGQTPDISAISKDLPGNNRFYNNGVVDMGAYEYQGNASVGVAGVWYVKAGGTGSGVSWDCPVGNLKFAISAAATGEQVWVAGGTYQPVTDGTYAMKEGVKIYGGFAGTEGSLADRNLTIVANKTTLQAYGHTVLINSGLTLTKAAVLDGFTITGSTNGPAIQNLSGASPMLANLVVTGNGNSGIYINASSPLLVNCSFIGNSSFSDGGGVLISNASPTLTNCLIAGNTANNGGGVLISNSSVVLTNCTIVGNTATGQGAGICNYSGLISKLRNSIVYGNNKDNFNNANLSIEYSLVQGESSTNNHNIAGNIDPLFVNAAGGNYRLQPCSPIVNKAFNFYEIGQVPDLSNITTDLDKNPRIREHAVDIGAYEFGGASRGLAVDGDVAAGTVSGNYLLTTNPSDCKILAYLSPNGGAPLSGAVTAKVWVAGSQPANFLKRHYQITPTTNAAGATAKVTLYFTQQEFTAFNAASPTKLPLNALDAENYKANLLIEKRSGSSNDESGLGLPGSYTGSIQTITPSAANGKVEWNADASRWEVSFDVTGFSGFFVKTIQSALPLKLISFTAFKELGSNLLQWSTVSEVNTDNFEVQTSGDAKKFMKLATVAASGSGNHQYSYNDLNNYNGNTYYRLKMSDLDGTFTYSKIISMAGEGNSALIYPNPSGSVLIFQVSNALLKSTATLYDVTGRRLQSFVVTNGQQQINISSLATGQYILKFADGTSEKFVKE